MEASYSHLQRPPKEVAAPSTPPSSDASSFKPLSFVLALIGLISSAYGAYLSCTGPSFNYKNKPATAFSLGGLIALIAASILGFKKSKPYSESSSPTQASSEPFSLENYTCQTRQFNQDETIEAVEKYLSDFDETFLIGNFGTLAEKMSNVEPLAQIQTTWYENIRGVIYAELNHLIKNTKQPPKIVYHENSECFYSPSPADNQIKITTYYDFSIQQNKKLYFKCETEINTASNNAKFHITSIDREILDESEPELDQLADGTPSAALMKKIEKVRAAMNFLNRVSKTVDIIKWMEKEHIIIYLTKHWNLNEYGYQLKNSEVDYPTKFSLFNLNNELLVRFNIIINHIETNPTKIELTINTI